jgi:hypothetical protein
VIEVCAVGPDFGHSSHAETVFSFGVSEDPEPSIEPGLIIKGPSLFAGPARFTLHVPYDGTLDVTVFRINGARVMTLVHGPVDAGTHELSWTAADERGQPLTAGVYFIRVIHEDSQGRSRHMKRKCIYLR